MTPAFVAHARLFGRRLGPRSRPSSPNVCAARLRERISRFLATTATIFVVTLGVTSVAAFGPATSTSAMANAVNEAAARLRASHEPLFSAEQLDALASTGGAVHHDVPRHAP